MAGFAELGLSSWLVEQCRQLGLKQPTPVQLGCIPAILEGRDCLGCAKTGSGKTAAFVLPILQKLSEDPYGIFCLVLTPTRELAYQIAEQFRVLGKPLGLKDCIIVGGMDMVAQALELSRKPHVVIATPGRLADHLRSSSTFSIKKIRFLVLDEADRLLEQGCTDFTVDLEAILAAVPARRQTLLFSATLTDTLRELQGLATNQPFFWEAQAPVRTVEQLDQRYLLVPEKVKDAYLVHLIQNFQDEHQDWSIIIFTNTCKTCQILCMMLRKFGFPAVALHSTMRQKERFAALAKFKSSIYRILIATDVASRGLDIPTVQVVINHNTPGLPKIYIHRVGRTARAGEWTGQGGLWAPVAPASPHHEESKSQAGGTWGRYSPQTSNPRGSICKLQELSFQKQRWVLWLLRTTYAVIAEQRAHPLGTWYPLPQSPPLPAGSCQPPLPLKAANQSPAASGCVSPSRFAAAP
uniref:RNA helicase n=1 Tax=Equus caballus TaxID=9796 RepID=A0A9L0SR98_HORSE